MSRLLLFSVIFVLVAASPEQKPRRQPNRPPAIDSFTSSATTIQICPFPTSVFKDKAEVDLLVNATDPDGDSLSYEYSTKEGTISGKGRLVVWKLEGLPRGPHQVRVTVRDGKGGKASAALTLTTVDASVCDPPPPPCPVIKVSCPDEMDHSKPFTFSALIEGKNVRPSSITRSGKPVRCASIEYRR